MTFPKIGCGGGAGGGGEEGGKNKKKKGRGPDENSICVFHGSPMQTL